jgi:hypothetical protein
MPEGISVFEPARQPASNPSPAAVERHDAQVRSATVQAAEWPGTKIYFDNRSECWSGSRNLTSVPPPFSSMNSTR